MMFNNHNDELRTQNSELRNLFDIIHVFKCTAYC